MAEMMMRSAVAVPEPSLASKPTPSPSAAEDKLVGFGQRIKSSQKEQLKRLAFWSRRNERVLLEKALAEFFARQDPDQLRPIPNDEV